MYNLTVSEAHTYYVGNDGWLVHNCDTIIDPDKFKYFFGNATGAKNAAHNAPRTAQNAQELARLGIHDTLRGHQWLQEQLEAAAGRTDNIREVFKDEFGSHEVRETLLAGPSGKFSRMKSTWEKLPSGSRRITTVIIQGGKK